MFGRGWKVVFLIIYMKYTAVVPLQKKSGQSKNALDT